MSAEGLFVQSRHAAASFLNRLCGFCGGFSWLIKPTFGWNQTFRAGFGFARAPPGWCALDHGRDSILVPGGLSLITGHSHNYRAVASPHVAFEMKDLLPGPENELAIRNGHRERWPEQRGL